MTNLNETIKSLYEACSAGEITVDERENLIEEARTKELFQEEVENLRVSENNENMFNKVKKVLYLRCADGAITESQRDAMIAMAYDKYMIEEVANAGVALANEIGELRSIADYQETIDKLLDDWANNDSKNAKEIRKLKKATDDLLKALNKDLIKYDKALDKVHIKFDAASFTHLFQSADAQGKINNDSYEVWESFNEEAEDEEKTPDSKVVAAMKSFYIKMLKLAKTIIEKIKSIGEKKSDEENTEK